MTARVLSPGMRGERGRAPTAAAERPRRPLLLTTEPWFTFTIVLVAFMSAAYSIEAADWVREMPSLMAAALIGLVTGYLLALAPMRAAPLHLAGIASGLAVAFGATMQTMRLADPLTQSGLTGRWSELWLRLRDWGRALVEGGISTDPLPFVLLLVFGIWLMSYMASWAVFRWRNAWLALLPAGFALLTNISYLRGQPSGELIAFLFAAMLLVTRLEYLRAAASWQNVRTWRPPYMAAEVFTFAIWIALMLIVAAWLIPTANNWGPLADRWSAAISPLSDRIDRVGRVFIGIGSKRGQHIHSFGDALPLQGKVSLDDPTVLFSVVAPQPLYMRAAVYDRYTGAGWTASSGRTQPLLGTSVDAASFGTATTREQLRRAVVVDVTVGRSVAPRRLLSVGDPLAASVGAKLLTGADPADALALVPDARVEDGAQYSTAGTVSAASALTLLQSRRNYPQWVVDRYLQLPSDLPQDVRDLAQRTAGRIESPYAAARAIEAHLRSDYHLNINVPAPPPRRDGVAYFLFDAKRGYFDHYASAMAVMLRTLGIPARVSTGFALEPGDLDAVSKAYVVMERRAWAWPEAYFTGLGWVEFNPTPGLPLIVRPGEDPQIDPLAFGGSDEPTQEELELLLLQDASRQPVTESESAAGLGPVQRALLAVFRWAVLAAMAALLAWGAALALWTYWFRGLSTARARWAKLQQLSGWAGVRVPPHFTALDAAGRLEAALGADLDLHPLARGYTRERYGGSAAASGDGGDGGDGDEVEAEALAEAYTSARNRLVRRILRRAVTSGPRALTGRQAPA
ncbi:MAG: transglutaminase domain-containing protein [Dehalococcoidia bacterium]|nr:transglutaminase domain-containing protein [Dehalococcoidia bacterium]